MRTVIYRLVLHNGTRSCVLWLCTDHNKYCTWHRKYREVPTFGETQTLEGYDRNKMHHVITRMSTKKENTMERHRKSSKEATSEQIWRAEERPTVRASCVWGTQVSHCVWNEVQVKHAYFIPECAWWVKTWDSPITVLWDSVYSSMRSLQNWLFQIVLGS